MNEIHWKTIILVFYYFINNLVVAQFSKQFFVLEILLSLSLCIFVCFFIHSYQIGIYIHCRWKISGKFGVCFSIVGSILALELSSTDFDREKLDESRPNWKGSLKIVSGFPKKNVHVEKKISTFWTRQIS